MKHLFANPITLLLFGVFMTWQATKLPIGSARMPGPGFFPFYLGIIILILGLPILYEELKKFKEKEREENIKPWRVYFTLFSLFIYALILESLGYLVSTFLLLGGLLITFSPNKLAACIFSSFIITTGSYLVFTKLLGVLLPKGILPF